MKRLALLLLLALAASAHAQITPTPTVTVTPVVNATQHVLTFEIAGRGAKDFSRLEELDGAKLVVAMVENLGKKYMDCSDGFNDFTLRPDVGAFTFGNLNSKTIMSWKAQGRARLTIFYWK